MRSPRDWQSRNKCGELLRADGARKKHVDAVENFRGRVRVMHLLAQLPAVAHAVREKSSELLHLADRVGYFRGNQALKVGREQMVAVVFRRLRVRTRRNKISDLPEDPGIG